MDRLRRCTVRDQYGHRCRRHLNHVVEVSNSKTGLALPDGPDDQHIAFGRSFGSESLLHTDRTRKRRGWTRREK